MDQAKETAAALQSRLLSLDSDSRRKLAVASACVVGFVVVRRVYCHTSTYVDRRRARKRKLNQTQTSKGKLLQKLVGLGTPVDNQDTVTRLTYNDVREKLRSNQLSAVDLLQAYQAKAFDVDRRLNCVTEVIYDADVTALYLDSVPREERGRLHGVPLSVKECIGQASFDSTYGCASRCLKPGTETAVVLQLLMNEGAVPFVRTNVSMCTRGVSCNNPVFGETLNPFDLKRTSGGSSGGEAALIGGGGSLLGIGSDVGGSIRIPASYCGIYGFKPTSARCSLKGTPRFLTTMKSLFYCDVYGPLSRDFELLVEVMRVLFSDAMYDLDFTIPRLLFNDFGFEDSEPLRIGIYTSFGDSPLTVTPVPAVERNVRLVRRALESRGHTCVDWTPPRVGDACKLIVEISHWDAAVGIKQFVSDEVLVSPEISYFSFVTGLNPLLKKLVAPVLKLTNPVLGTYLKHSKGFRRVTDLAVFEAAVESYRREFENSWLDAELDVVLCPVLPFVAPKVGETENIVFSPLYTKIYNFLDYPAGVVPVGTVLDEDIQNLKENYPRNTSDTAAIFESQVGSLGMPIGVQCVAMKFHDELALRLMKEVKNACL